MKQLPNGFITKENGKARHQTIQLGDLLGLLQDTYGKELDDSIYPIYLDQVATDYSGTSGPLIDFHLFFNL